MRELDLVHLAELFDMSFLLISEILINKTAVCFYFMHTKTSLNKIEKVSENKRIAFFLTLSSNSRKLYTYTSCYFIPRKI